MRHSFFGIASLGVLVVGATAHAQHSEPRFEPVSVDSGVVYNAAGEREVVFTQLIEVADASWLRVDFDRAELGAPQPGGQPTILRITSMHDGGSLRWQAHHVDQWAKRSAYFNGDAVTVEVIADPGAQPSFITISQVLAGPTLNPETICDGIDDRTLSTDPRVGRGWTTGGSPNCTAWLIDDCAKCMLAAGHCGFGGGQIHFNVPISTSTGQVVQPPPEDQYAIDVSSQQRVNGGLGNDYFYFGCFPNPNTNLTAFEAQGSAFVLGPPPSNPNETIRITGHGTTSAPVSPTFHRAQKTHSGPYAGLTGTRLQYRVDTTGGNSGSPVINDTTGEAIGIHTHGGCSNGGGANSGTSLTNAGLQSALANPTGLCAQATCCYPDCDGSGVLNILDYICFGDEFAVGGSYADCDGNGSLNILDYICFGDAFAVGCP